MLWTVCRCRRSAETPCHQSRRLVVQQDNVGATADRLKVAEGPRSARLIANRCSSLTRRNRDRRPRGSRDCSGPRSRRGARSSRRSISIDRIVPGGGLRQRRARYARNAAHSSRSNKCSPGPRPAQLLSVKPSGSRSLDDFAHHIGQVLVVVRAVDAGDVLVSCAVRAGRPASRENQSGWALKKSSSVRFESMRAITNRPSSWAAW